MYDPNFRNKDQRCSNGLLMCNFVSLQSLTRKNARESEVLVAVVAQSRGKTKMFLGSCGPISVTRIVHAAVHFKRFYE